MHEWEDSLKVGSIVEGRFTNNFNFFRFKGVISRINLKTFRVNSLEDGVNGWDIGHEFIIPRRGNKIFSRNNGVF